MVRASERDESPYTVLDLPEGASLEQIDRAFLKKSASLYADIDQTKFNRLSEARKALLKQLGIVRQTEGDILTPDDVIGALKEALSKNPSMTWDQLTRTPLPLFGNQPLTFVLRDNFHSVFHAFGNRAFRQISQDKDRDFKTISWYILEAVGRRVNRYSNGQWLLDTGTFDHIQAGKKYHSRTAQSQRKPAPAPAAIPPDVKEQKPAKETGRLAKLWNRIKAVVNKLWSKPASFSKKDSTPQPPTPSEKHPKSTSKPHRPDSTPAGPTTVLRIKDR